MKTITFETKDTCAKEISFSIDPNGKVRNVKFQGGCPGGLKVMAILVEGMDKDKAIKIMTGVTCGKKTTSCGDQLAQALKEN